ncbi:MAG TPA: VWA domain-containing protein [Capsulimonadaceae bacterium]|jgi:uncharacterized protein YegL
MNELIDGKMVELPEDTGGEPRCAVVILTDVSASMAGEPIAQLNAGLAEFQRALADDPLASRRCEVALVKFGGTVEIVQDFAVASTLPTLPTLRAGGNTPMGEAIVKAADMLATKKAAYRSEGRAQYRPWIFMITDGQPTDDYSQALTRVHQGDQSKSFLFYAVGCFGADMGTLGMIAPPSTPPLYLQGAKFRELFRWLSDSMGRVAASTPGGMTALPSAGNWGTIAA